jgi:hypothetical protein
MRLAHQYHITSRVGEAPPSKPRDAVAGTFGPVAILGATCVPAQSRDAGGRYARAGAGDWMRNWVW